jgi:hypothetical protein
MSSYGLHGPLNPIRRALGGAVSRQVRSVRFSSQISPTVSIDPNQQRPRTAAQAARSGGGESLLRFIRPTMELETTFGPVTIAPWGRPRGNYFWPVVILAGVGAAVSIGLAVRGMTPKRKRRRR